MRRHAAVLVLAAILGVLVAALAGWWRLHGRLPRISDAWPVDLARPGGWLVDRQLKDIADDPELCASIAVAPHVEARPVQDKPFERGCGWANAVRTTRIGGARLEVGTITCEMAAAVALWMNHSVQPAALAHLGSRVVALDHLGAYACRNIAGTRTQSEHATANALDIAGFRLADGRRITLLADWGRDRPEGRFLAAVHKGACRYFRVALGPEYDDDHKNHFHFDRGRWTACE